MLRRAKTNRTLTVGIGTALPSIVAAVIEYVLTGGIKGVVPLVAAVGGGGTTLVALYFLGAFSNQLPTNLEQIVAVVPISNAVVAVHTSSESTLDASQSEAFSDRFFTPRTPRELVEEQQGNTSLAADEVSKRHQGHWMEVTGRVKDVEKTYRAIQIFLQTNDSNTYVHLDFDEDEWEDRLRSLRKGDVVTAIGEITNTTDTSISLGNCELKSVRSKAESNAGSSVA